MKTYIWCFNIIRRRFSCVVDRFIELWSKDWWAPEFFWIILRFCHISLYNSVIYSENTNRTMNDFKTATGGVIIMNEKRASIRFIERCYKLYEQKMYNVAYCILRDEGLAESLIGDSMSYPNITKEIDGTTITILSVVRDNNSAVIEYTLEKAGGVDALNYSQLDNEAKWAWISEESTFNFSIGSGSTIVDLENSTDEKLYCYEYITLDDHQNYVEKKIEEYPCKLKEIYALDYEDPKREELENQVVSSSTKIPFSSNVVAETTFVNPAGGKIKVSLLSLKVDMSKGFGLSEVQAADPVNCYYVAINYKDGTNYVVMESNADGRHSCDVEKDNTAYSCGTLTGEYVMLFNRLVDTDQISSITVNDVEYTLE